MVCCDGFHLRAQGGMDASNNNIKCARWDRLTAMIASLIISGMKCQ